MDFSAKSFHSAINWVKQASPCLVVGVFQGAKPILTESGKILDKATNKQISGLLAHGDLRGDAGSTLMLYNPDGIKAKRILLLGLGKKQDLSDASFRSAVGCAAKCLNQCHIRAADFALLDVFRAPSKITRQARNIVEAIEQSLYRYDQTKSARKKPGSLKRIALMTARNQLANTRLGIKQGQAIANGVSYAKTMANLPGNICTPSYLARQAKELQKTHAIKTTILNEAEMKRKKMGSLLSVSRGSREPAKLIVMQYKGGKRGENPVVLVGKGLTFDAGGISIKPAAAMDEMKYDMCGGASVFGALRAVAEMQLAINLVGIVPSSENLPDGAANKPGDIVTSMAGKTIEILNTDAEGRLILCDALTYAERFKPAVVVDIATLTGACVIALGHHASGLFSNNDKLAKQLLAAGEASGDRAWQLPLWDDYTKQLNSDFADLANIGGRGGGAVTAACFLKQFTENYKWAHLDVAGTAWKSSSPKGATGRPVALLVEFIMNYVKL
ncbi:leucyl aminopeptidase [Candidatus Spongiihabitans sp.]|uniref:leucyl aminopeptidase n=1 Tax=Candidatus Spongiihabitans sp. TaxID=3101308 RepID=UPI003C7C7790